VAAQLSKEDDLKVETSKGGLGELSVSIDGQKGLCLINRVCLKIPPFAQKINLQTANV